ncbi:hypothetical protein NQ314_019982 [Rhamnusium bicolor]|uniref:Uncharacterized protein n=1 Tax=Rhamnusium bicolor TaxID=1586634 RepID=A0AAV8WN16_9CUCU|nr:hypothetical protein NQ314_019982 [Rhamnusium bicolor]
MQVRLIIILLNIMITPCLPKEEVKSRQKRILWVTQDGRLALPPGTTLVISPSLSMPFLKIFVSVDFNKLGLTDNENPYGVLPPLLARSMGRAAGGLLADYIGNLLEHRRSKRSNIELPKKPHVNAFHGGERALLYIAVEELLENFGMNGRAASKSPYADMLNEYVEAENAGRGKLGGPAECWPYMKDCPKSLFLPRHNHYRDGTESNELSEMDSLEDDTSKVTYNPSITNM